MIIRKLALAGAAALLACGGAWGQGKPTYDEALAAVVDGGCERSETERYIRFFCEQAEALWYFTHEGRPEHSAYFVTPAYQPRDADGAIVPPGLRDGLPITGGFGQGRPSPTPSSREAGRERLEAWHTWQREMIAVSRTESAQMRPPQRRDRGKLYPLEPS